jgi:NADH dehydrogenase
VIWAGGIAAAPLAGRSGLPLGRGDRVVVQPDLTPAGFPRVYVLGDLANIPGPDGESLAMIGRNAAVAEIGKNRHEVHGKVAFLMWLGMHATLMTGIRTRVDAFIDWAWDYFSPTRASQVLDRSDAPRIDWGDDR